MKAFFASTKGKVIVGLGTVTVVAAAILAVILLNAGHRIIEVNGLNGTTSVTFESETKEAFVGQHLSSGHEVLVNASSDLTLKIDTDKYVLAEENTHFFVEATGKEGSALTKIRLDKGSSLCRIDNKLGEKEGFTVDTTNASLSVRGTVYRTTCKEDADGRDLCIEKDLLYDLAEITEHVYEEEPGSRVESTCTEQGYYYTICGVCGLHEEKVMLPLKEHEIQYEEHQADNCSEEGYRLKICVDCDEVMEEVAIPAKGHEYGDYVVVIEPTCTKPGQEVARCTGCDDEKKRAIKKLEHNLSERKIIKEPTYTAEGYEGQVCLLCNEVVNKTVIPKLIEKEVDKKPRVDIAKVTEEKPTVEDNKDNDSSNSSSNDDSDPCSSGHDFSGAGTVINAATCENEGTLRKTCSRCGVTRDEGIPKLAHAYDGVPYRPSTTEGQHERECTVCHTPDIASCTIDSNLGKNENDVDSHEGTCGVCGGRVFENHNFASVVPDPEFATQHDKVCADCGAKVQENCTKAGGAPQQLQDWYLKHAYKCTICYDDIIEDCDDQDSDNKCDACGGEMVG